MHYLKIGALVAVIISSLISCASTCEPIVVEPVPLPFPMARELPRASEAELACLSDLAYEKLMVRDLQRKAFGDECLAIIKSTH